MISRQEIEERLSRQQLDGIEALILDYEKQSPEDLELFTIKTIYSLMIDDLIQAEHWAKAGVKKNPCNAAVNYNMAMISEMLGKYDVAVEYYCKTYAIVESTGNNEIPQSDVQNKIVEMIKQAGQEYANDSSEMKQEKGKPTWDELTQNCRELYGLQANVFHNGSNIIGRPYTDYYGNRAYIGQYSNMSDTVRIPENCIQATGEIRTVDMIGTSYMVNTKVDAIVPILSEEADNKVNFTEDGKQYCITITNNKVFQYYRVKAGTVIESEYPIVIGHPIPLVVNEEKKRLVLNIFVDGLCEKLLEEQEMEKIMPNTYRFFSKGVICKNAYTSADWTYPSVATYNTGLDITKHMMIHNKLYMGLPTDVTLLAEYFKEQGYQTAKIGGNWRVTPNYGYFRGIDRCLYQHMYMGMRVHEVVESVIEHIEMMKDTNQYVWCSIGELHQIADNMDLGCSIQSELSLSERIVDEGISSVKQEFSENKKLSYIKQVKRIDLRLGMLYQYIEENYKDHEIVVSLLSDHGQGYLVKPDEFFLSKNRSNVALMFRGGEITPGNCEELISAADYVPAVCRLSNISLKQEEISGRIPKIFGGEEERDFVITESIHPGDPYSAVVYWKDYVCNFMSKDQVSQDGRYDLSLGHEIELRDFDNKVIIDESKLRHNFDIIKEHIAGNLIYGK